MDRSMDEWMNEQHKQTYLTKRITTQTKLPRMSDFCFFLINPQKTMIYFFCYSGHTPINIAEKKVIKHQIKKKWPKKLCTSRLIKSACFKAVGLLLAVQLLP